MTRHAHWEAVRSVTKVPEKGGGNRRVLLQVVVCREGGKRGTFIAVRAVRRA